jgi:hypothetical protein
MTHRKTAVPRIVISLPFVEMQVYFAVSRLHC